MARSSRPAGYVVVPVRPGTAFEPPAPPAWSERLARPLIVAGAVVALGAIAAVVVVLLTRDSSRTATAPAVTTTAAVPVTPAPTQPKPAPTKEELARAKALRIAARLPVSLASAALLRSGSSLYVVGGSKHGQPADAVWRIDLVSGRTQRVETFIEPLADAASARHGGDLYIAGGWTGEKLASAVLRWSPGGTATFVARLPVALRGASAAFDGGKLYVTGGKPRQVFVVDVDAGTVTQAQAAPARLQKPATNLDYLASSLG